MYESRKLGFGAMFEQSGPPRQKKQRIKPITNRTNTRDLSTANIVISPGKGSMSSVVMMTRIPAHRQQN